MDFENKTLKELFDLVDKIGKKHYHRLTKQDFENYQQYEHWRYINSNFGAGSTQDSKDWVRNNSDFHCPICNSRYQKENGRTVDHKLPRSKYPWLSMEFKNLWVICRDCNQEKNDMDWYEYERYILNYHPEFYEALRVFRPTQLLKALNSSQQ